MYFYCLMLYIYFSHLHSTSLKYVLNVKLSLGLRSLLSSDEVLISLKQVVAIDIFC